MDVLIRILVVDDDPRLLRVTSGLVIPKPGLCSQVFLGQVAKAYHVSCGVA